MIPERKIQGLSLKVGPLGENDRLITILSDQEGITRLAVPGARRPKSRLAAATPLSLIEAQVVGRRGLARIKQLKIIHNFNAVGQKIETLAAAQALSELSLMLVSSNDPIPGLLSTVLMHLKRLEVEGREVNKDQCLILAIIVQACIHLLAIGGYGIPLQRCCKEDLPLDPPIGNWEWKCSLIPDEGFAIGSFENSTVKLNPSELALLQRLVKSELPFGKDGKLMGPKNVWLRLLAVIDFWIATNLPKNIHSLAMLREVVIT